MIEKDAIQRWPVTFTQNVAWGEMDALGHVNNIIYLRWFESARIAYCMQAGMGDMLEGRSMGPILARTVIDYRIPVTFPDTVSIDIAVTHIGNTSFTTVMQIRSKAQSDRIVALGEAVIVMVDYRTGEKIRVPDAVREKMTQLMNA